MRIVTKEKIVAGAVALLCTGLTAGAAQVGSYRFNSGANAFTAGQGNITMPITGNFGTMTIKGAEATT